MATLSGHASYLEHAAQFNLELEECTERRPMLVLRTKTAWKLKFDSILF